MTLYYSPTVGGFFDTDMGYPQLPEDKIEITAEQHRDLIDGLNRRNKAIQVTDGVITLVDRVYVPTWDDIRTRRDLLLANSDYTQVPDWPGDGAAWAAYRQQLRDLPQTYDAPEDVVWPTKPGG